jgi:hypothetical protein
MEVHLANQRELIAVLDERERASLEALLAKLLSRE